MRSAVGILHIHRKIGVRILPIDSRQSALHVGAFIGIELYSKSVVRKGGSPYDKQAVNSYPVGSLCVLLRRSVWFSLLLGPLVFQSCSEIISARLLRKESSALFRFRFETKLFQTIETLYGRQ